MPEIKFNKKIYPKVSIRNAIAAYSHIAKFSVKDQKDYTEVKIKDIDPEVGPEIAEEFSNYVLSETKKCL